MFEYDQEKFYYRITDIWEDPALQASNVVVYAKATDPCDAINIIRAEGFRTNSTTIATKVDAFYVPCSARIYS